MIEKSDRDEVMIRDRSSRGPFKGDGALPVGASVRSDEHSASLREIGRYTLADSRLFHIVTVDRSRFTYFEWATIMVSVHRRKYVILGLKRSIYATLPILLLNEESLNMLP